MDKETLPKTTTKKINLPQVIQVRIKEMGNFWSENDSTIIRRAINFLYDEEYRKKAFGYQAGAMTALGRIQRENKRNEREALIKTLTEMTDEQLLDFLIEVGYIKQDEIDQEFNKTIHFSVHTDPATGKELYRDYQTVAGTMENPTFYEDLDTIIKSLIKEKKI